MVEPNNRVRRGRLKRPHVPDSQRKRVARACLPCREHKEKCGGGDPCLRCQQQGRICRFAPVPHRPAQTPNGNSNWPEKEHQMKRIINHFLGNVSFEAGDLKKIADSLDTNQTSSDPDLRQSVATVEDYSLDPVSTNTIYYSGEFSHWNFSKMLERRLQSLGNQSNPSESNGFFRAPSLQTPGSCISLAKKYFPPKRVGEFLLDTFLQYAQTNYFYFDEKIFRQKLDFYYAKDDPFSINDSAWVCTILLTFAVGTQYAYMHTTPTSAGQSDPQETADDRIGLDMYRFSCRLIPDLITTANIEAVQAFLLMGVYTMPIDTSGLAYTYSGLAIKMAVQNGMHRRFIGSNASQELIEIRNRLWWSAYSLESRISILHGRPVSIAPGEIDAPLPVDQSTFRSDNKSFNLGNFTTCILLTRHLARISESIKGLRRSEGATQERLLSDLINTRHQIKAWWEGLANSTTCRDLTPGRPLFRPNVHLELYYNTIMIYLGRPFIISQSSGVHESTQSDQNNVSEKTNILRNDSLEAAIKTVESCRLLQVSVGLARNSYTEFNSCRVALLALIAHSIHESSSAVLEALNNGMVTIRQMCGDLESKRSEMAVIEALERARQSLVAHTAVEQPAPEPTTSEYDQFKEWAKLWRADPSADADPPDHTEVIEEASPNNSVPSFDGFFSSFPDELYGFSAIPGINCDFQSTEELVNMPAFQDLGWNLEFEP